MTLRRFLRWSEDQATTAGLTPAQHQLLVAIKGHPGPEPPAIRDITDYLLLQSHSTVGLVDRAEAAGVVRRQHDSRDGRVVRVYLTEKGERLVENLTTAHLTQLYNLAEALNHLLEVSRPDHNRPEGETLVELTPEPCPPLARGVWEAEVTAMAMQKTTSVTPITARVIIRVRLRGPVSFLGAGCITGRVPLEAPLEALLEARRLNIAASLGSDLRRWPSISANVRCSPGARLMPHLQ